MSLFAASFDTLKKRTTQLLDNLDKQKDDKSAPETQDSGIDIPYPQVAAAMGCREDSILVSYEVQNDPKDRETALYVMPLGGAISVTVAMVRASFPLPGNYHLRFKAPTADGSFGGCVWIDLASDQDLVPVFNGGVAVKALRLPDGSPGSPSRAPSQASRSRPATSAQGASPHGVGDLMELDLSKGSHKDAQAQAKAPGPQPPVQLDRAKLVAERQAREKREYEEKIKRHEEQKKRDAQSKKEKLELNDVLSKELNDWAKTPDGQSYKEIRTLLSTMHSVTWEGASWQPLNLSELVADSNIKKYYRKAILMAHPDRHQSASSEQQVRADRIFNALNESFKSFTSS
ncbi:AUXI1 [Symbiodinium necroappetens]|uniref:AUXI1 protein n=1 Tax=Symbiodinium necroappetens TaxID=1628268 RepID=A0A813CRQ3_9DINO|nr:AUXI1 [Symbiodinium necroappetens]